MVGHTYNSPKEGADQTVPASNQTLGSRRPGDPTGRQPTRLEHVSDLPPDLPRLQTLEVYLRLQLAAVQAAIVRAEQQAAIYRRADLAAVVPDWVVGHGIGQGSPPIAVHIGGCHMAGHRVKTLQRDQAVRALTDGVEACSHCRPDTELGLLD